MDIQPGTQTHRHIFNLTMTLDFWITPEQSSTLLTGPASKTWHTGALTRHLRNTSEDFSMHVAGQE